VNLAPVADVPPASAGAMSSRVFAGGAEGAAERTRAAIAGMWSARLAATAKHFPGLGGAQVNTDDAATTSTAELGPFRAAVDADVPLVMLSHALYPALDPKRIASQSRRVVQGLLREELGFRGVAITDSIEAAASLATGPVERAAERAVRAGVDLVLTTGAGSALRAYRRLLATARRSPAFARRVRESAARVEALQRAAPGRG
jgi:beta-N-acetylhexosaminidase